MAPFTRCTAWGSVQLEIGRHGGAARRAVPAIFTRTPSRVRRRRPTRLRTAP